MSVIIKKKNILLKKKGLNPKLTTHLEIDEKNNEICQNEAVVEFIHRRDWY